MDMNPVEWSQAKNLLVKLSQVLSPLTVQTISSSMFLHRRFFIPPSEVQEGTFLNKHPVRLLTAALHKVQKEMEALMGETPIEIVQKEQPGKATEIKPQEKEVQLNTLPVENLGEEGQKTNSPAPRSEQIFTHSKQQPEGTVREESKKVLPLVAQVKILIHQVQDAIVSLSTSAFIQDPQEAPLREELKKLKPHLDRIIESIAEAQEKEAISRFPLRPSVPTTSREEFVKNLSPSIEPLDLPILQRKKAIEGTSPKQEIQQEQQEKTSPEKKSAVSQETLPGQGEKTGRIPKQNVKRGEEGGQEKTFESTLTPFLITRPHEGEKGEKPSPRQIVLPGAPFVSDTRRLTPPRKKKRKGFWFKDKEERNNS